MPVAPSVRTRELVALIAGAVAVAAAFLLLGRLLDTSLRRARAQIEDATQGLAVESDSGQTQAGLQRFRARREAVAAMRADLRRLVALETAFIADSGQPTSNFFPPHFQVTSGKGQSESRLEMIRVWGPSWWATMHNVYIGITCWVYVGPDTTMSHSPSGEPACASDSAVPPALGKP